MDTSYKWYILQVKSGSEHVALKIIKKIIKDEIETCNSKESYIKDIKEVFLPVSNNKTGDFETKSKSRLMPGYIFVKMNMNENSSRNILSIPSVSRFLGDYNKGAKVVSDDEIERIKKRISNIQGSNDSYNSSFTVGDKIKVTDGPFKNFTGKIESIDYDKNMMRVSIMIFGRSTPVDLEIEKVKKG